MAKFLSAAKKAAQKAAKSGGAAMGLWIAIITDPATADAPGIEDGGKWEWTFQNPENGNKPDKKSCPK